MKKLEPNEQRLIFAAALALLFYFFWLLALSPVVAAADRSRGEAAQAKRQLAQLMNKPRIASYRQITYSVYPQELQLNHLMTFLDDRFRWHGIKLVSLKQTFADHKLTIDLEIESTYGQLNGFLGALEKIDTLLVVERAEIVQQGSRVTTTFRLASGYL